MRPRAIVFDLFGDYVRYRGGRIGLRPLTDLLALFGVQSDAVRVVMSRLRREGWFTSERVGRQSVYVISDRTWALLDEGRARIFERAAASWAGQWYVVIYSVPETDRAARERLRKQLSWLGYGPLAASTWVCPHDRHDAAAAALADEPAARVDLLTARSRGRAADREMAARCWDLTALDRDYRRFLTTWSPRLADFEAGRVRGPDALVTRTRLVHAYRHFPFRDPDLPAELLPEQWSGHRAHRLFLAAYDALRAPAEDYFSAAVDPLPEPASA